MRVILTTVVAQPSEVAFEVRIDLRGADPADVPDGWADDVAEAIDSFVYERCSACGFDIEDHIVTPGPFGNPFLWCEKEEQ